MGWGAFMGLVDVGMVGGAVEVGGDVVGEQEFYAGGVHVVMGGDWGDGFVHVLFLLVRTRFSVLKFLR